MRPDQEVRFTVGAWLVEPELARITRDSEETYLRSQLMELLVYLARHQGRVVSAEALLDSLWAGKIVTTGTVYNCVAELRHALTNSGDQNAYIETIPKKGYRLVAPVSYDASPADPGSEPTKPAQAEEKPPGRGKQAVLPGLALAGVVLLALFALWFLPSRDTPDDVRYPGIENAPEKSVAVLAFDDLSPAGDHEWFADGITEEILNSLARLPGLKVTARTSAFYFKGHPGTVPDIADQLGVRYIVEGSVRRVADDLRITYQVIRAADGFHVYSDDIDRQAEDIFRVQREISVHIAKALNIVLDDAQRDAVFALGTSDVDAYEAYLKGRDLVHDWFETEEFESLLLATSMFNEAIAADPGFANAYLYRAHNYMRFFEANWAPSVPDRQLTPEQIEVQVLADYANASRYTSEPAINLFSALSEMLLSDDFTRLRSLAGQFDPAIAAAAIPDGLDTMHVLALLLVAGHTAEVREYADDRIARNPLDSLGYNQAYLAAAVAGDHEAATRYLERARETVGNTMFTEFNMLMSRIVTRQWDEAAVLAATPDWGMEASREPFLAFVLTLAGRGAEADPIMQRLGRQQRSDVFYALALRATGEDDAAQTFISQIDDAPFGNLVGVYLFVDFAGQFPFDITWTPNFAARLAEAGLTLNSFQFE